MAHIKTTYDGPPADTGFRRTGRVGGGLDFIIQLVMLALVMAGFALNGYSFDLGPVLLLAPVIILQTGILGLGCGIIVASLTILIFSKIEKTFMDTV